MIFIKCKADIIVKVIGQDIMSEEDLAKLVLETEIELNSKGMFMSEYGKTGIRVHLKGYKRS